MCAFTFMVKLTSKIADSYSPIFVLFQFLMTQSEGLGMRLVASSNSLVPSIRTALPGVL